MIYRRENMGRNKDAERFSVKGWLINSLEFA